MIDDDISEQAPRSGLTLMLAPDDERYQITYDELRAESQFVDGVRVSPAERILEWKQAVNRRKDQNDIALLRQFIAAQVCNEATHITYHHGQ